jgi:Protein of unknown function (DUF2742)
MIHNRDAGNGNAFAVSSSQQVNWSEVERWAAPFLDSVGSWPTIGTPEWCSLPMDDRRRWVAVIDAAQHWALRMETCQAAECEASHAISAAAGYDDAGHPVTWGAVAQRLRDHNEFYAQRPYLKRAAS